MTCFELVYDKFYRAVLVFFVFTGLFQSLFALGYEYTKDRINPPSNTPYYFPFMVFGVITFIQCVICLVIFCFGRKIKNDGSYGYDRLHSKAAKWHVIFMFLCYLGFVWGIVSLSLVTSHGLCLYYGDLEIDRNVCYYDIYRDENKAISIAGIVLCALGTLWEIFFIFVKSERVSVRVSTRKVACANKSVPSKNMKSQSKLTDGKSDRNIALMTNTNELPPNRLKPLSHKADQSYDEANNYITLLRRNKSAGHILGTGKSMEGMLAPQQPKPDESALSRARLKPSELGRNPYQLPPLPPQNPGYRAPDNMYTGSSYPDSELIPAFPSKSKSRK